MMGLKSFDCAARLIAGIETMHMVKKGQLRCPGGLAFSDADYFYSLAVLRASARLDQLIATEPD
jgi:putative transposase